MTTRQLTMAKITSDELSKLQDFLIELNTEYHILIQYHEDDEKANKDIAKLIRDKFPPREAILAPVNLSILLDNFQDKESTILEKPKYLMELYKILEDIEKHVNENPENSLHNTELLVRIKEINSEE